ncbi:hypothetical protein EXW46_19615 [Bacillus mycoides]|nr:hypothetical protein EXW46_19615 [Bacillus mycoides]
MWAVKLTPQNSAGTKKLGGRLTARKRPIGSTNNQWGMNNPPLIKVSLYRSDKNENLRRCRCLSCKRCDYF